MRAFVKRSNKQQMTFIQLQANQIKKIYKKLKLVKELKFMHWRILKLNNLLKVFKIKILECKNN